MRRDKRQQSASFTLKGFHDRLLASHIAPFYWAGFISIGAKLRAATCRRPTSENRTPLC